MIRLQFWLHFPAIFPAMCEFPAVVLSDSDESEDPAADNTSNAVLETVTNFRSGKLLGECLLDTELGRLALNVSLRAGLPG